MNRSSAAAGPARGIDLLTKCEGFFSESRSDLLTFAKNWCNGIEFVISNSTEPTKNNFHVSVGLVGIDNVFKALHGLKTTQNLSKNGPKTVPPTGCGISRRAKCVARIWRR